MSERPNALLELGGPYTFPDYRKKAAPSFENCEVALTEVGMDVAAGVKDWVKVKRLGMNEWYGGLRLYGDLTWRWDSEGKQLIYYRADKQVLDTHG